MALYSTYPGRFGKIFDRVYSLMDDTKGGTDASGRFVTPEEMLVSIGECYEDIANEGYFSTSTQIDITSGQADYNLLTLIPRMIKVNRVRKVSSADWLNILDDRGSLAVAKQYYGSNTAAKMAYLAGYNLTLIGTPTATETDALEVYYTYYPPYEITLSQVAVTSVDTGTKVRFAATANELIVGDYVCIHGSTNYSGLKLVTARTTDTFTITQTFVAETIGAAVTCHCEPRTPVSRDMVFARYCEYTRALKDSRGEWNKRVDSLAKLYQKEKAELLSDGLSPVLFTHPPRDL